MGPAVFDSAEDFLNPPWFLILPQKDPIELKGHGDSIEVVTWDPVRPEYLITTSRDKSVKVWDTRVEKATTVQTDSINMYTAFSPDGNTLAIGNMDNVINFLDIRKLKFENQINIQPDEAYEISWNPTGDLFFVTTGEGTVNVYEYPSLKQSYVINAHTGTCSCIKFDPKKRQFLNFLSFFSFSLVSKSFFPITLPGILPRGARTR